MNYLFDTYVKHDIKIRMSDKIQIKASFFENVLHNCFSVDFALKEIVE